MNEVMKERERILRELEKIKKCTMFTEWMQLGFNQACERFEIVVNGGTYEDFDSKRKDGGKDE